MSSIVYEGILITDGLTLTLFLFLAQVCVSSSLLLSFAVSPVKLLFAGPFHPQVAPCHPNEERSKNA